MTTQLIQREDFLSANFTNRMKSTLPKHLTLERMTRIILTEFYKNPKLAECDKLSFLAAIMKCCELGLEPSSTLGHAYLIPYRNNKKNTLECTLVIGYRGLLELARRSDQILTIYARCVYENDQFDLVYGLNETLVHIPAKLHEKESGKFIAAYAVAHLKSGGHQFEVMFADEIYKIRNNAASARLNNSAWKTDFDEMAKKTVVRRFYKYLPASTELQSAIIIDEKADTGSQNIAMETNRTIDEIDEETPTDSASKLVQQLEQRNRPATSSVTPPKLAAVMDARTTNQ